MVLSGIKDTKGAKMDAMEAILSRRSIRRYFKKPVPDEIIKELLQAAMSAPSAGNQQPWQFVVIKDRAILDEIPRVHPYSHMLNDAQVAILICGDLSAESHKGFWVQDCSAATENLLVAANAKGLGAVWLGVYPRVDRVEGIRRILNIPEHIVPLSLIPIGYPAEKRLKEDRYDAAKVHYDRW